MDAPKDGTPEARYKDIPFDKIAEAYDKSAGNMRLTATKLGIGRKTLERWRKQFPELHEMLTEVDDGLLDLTESKLLQAINDGNLTAIIFYLKTKGKHRGYIEGQIITANVNTNKSMSQAEAMEFIKQLESEC